jgi:large subunit ribosomal protein L15
MVKLNELSDNPGARKKRMRIGRGIGSGKGKTGGRGGKGQTARTGVRMNGFEGGQNPIYMRLPKRGFNNYTRVEYLAVNVGELEKHVEYGNLKAGDKITPALLVERGIVRGSKSSLIKLLAKGAIKTKFDVELHKASAAAIEALKKAGGSYTELKVQPKVVDESKKESKALGKKKVPTEKANSKDSKKAVAKPKSKA